MTATVLAKMATQGQQTFARRQHSQPCHAMQGFKITFTFRENPFFSNATLVCPAGTCVESLSQYLHSFYCISLCVHADVFSCALVDMLPPHYIEMGHHIEMS